MLDALNSIVVYILYKHASIATKRTCKRPVPWIINIFGLRYVSHQRTNKLEDKESMASYRLLCNGRYLLLLNVINKHNFLYVIHLKNSQLKMC